MINASNFKTYNLKIYGKFWNLRKTTWSIQNSSCVTKNVPEQDFEEYDTYGPNVNFVGNARARIAFSGKALWRQIPISPTANTRQIASIMAHLVFDFFRKTEIRDFDFSTVEHQITFFVVSTR